MIDLPAPAAGARRLVRIALPPDGMTDVLERLLSGAGAVEVRRDGDTLVAVFPPVEPAFLEDRVESWINLVDRSGATALSTALEGSDFLDGWRGLYAGADVARFRIRPPWLPAPGEGVLVRVDPRGGFGSGLHPSTRLTLELLDAVVDRHRGGRALDVGAGSGILSIAAARCGLSPVALELEPAAREACASVARANGFEFPVSNTQLADLEGTFALVFGNLPPFTLEMLLPGMWARVAPGGDLLISGTDQERLGGIVAAAGLRASLTRTCDGGAWAAAAIHRD